MGVRNLGRRMRCNARAVEGGWTGRGALLGRLSKEEVYMRLGGEGLSLLDGKETVGGLVDCPGTSRRDGWTGGV